MELLVLVALGAVGVVLIRSRVLAAAPAVRTPVQDTEPASGSALPVDLDFGPLDPLIEEYIVAPVVDWVQGWGELSPEEEAKRASDFWVADVILRIQAGHFDDAVRVTAAVDFQTATWLMLDAIYSRWGTIPVGPDGSVSGPNLDRVTRLVEARTALVWYPGVGLMSEEEPYFPPVEGVEVVVTDVGVIVGAGVVALEPAVVWEPEPTPEADRAAQLEAAAEAVAEGWDFPSFDW